MPCNYRGDCPLLCRAKVATSVRRMLNRVLAEAFGGWKQHASERKQEQQIVAQVAELPVRSLARRTWSAWWEAYQHKLKMRSTVQKLMHGTAIRVLHHWQVLTHNPQCLAAVIVLQSLAMPG